MYKTRTLMATSAFLALALLLPGATAQQVTVDTANTKTTVPPLLPEIDSHEITLAFVYTMPNAAYQASGVGQTTASATITVTCNDATNVLITGPQSTSFTIAPSGTPGADPSFDYQTKLSVSVTRDLPGLKKITCTYESFVDAISGGAPTPSPAIAQSNIVTGTFQVAAKFYSVVQAKVAAQIKEAGPQKEVPFEVALKNFGNAKTQIHFEINERPGGDRWNAVVPDDVIIESPTGAGTTEDVATFTVTTPYKNGWNNEQGTYRLSMATFAADNPEEKGIELFTNVLVRVRGVYVPTLEPLVMVGAVIGSALVARMTRDEE